MHLKIGQKRKWVVDCGNKVFFILCQSKLRMPLSQLYIMQERNRALCLPIKICIRLPILMKRPSPSSVHYLKHHLVIERGNSTEHASFQQFHAGAPIGCCRPYLCILVRCRGSPRTGRSRSSQGGQAGPSLRRHPGDRVGREARQCRWALGVLSWTPLGALEEVGEGDGE
jgi:hypothetical protein